jgi:hypothetical protein
VVHTPECVAGSKVIGPGAAWFPANTGGRNHRALVRSGADRLFARGRLRRRSPRQGRPGAGVAVVVRQNTDLCCLAHRLPRLQAERADQRLQKPEGDGRVQELSALTPPLLVLAVIVIAIVAFLRHEMGRKRPDESAPPDDIPAVPPISDHRADDQPSGRGASDRTGRA